jgi:hypothetical protein
MYFFPRFNSQTYFNDNYICKYFAQLDIQRNIKLSIVYILLASLYI